MSGFKKIFEKRFPSYLGGLLLGLAAMFGIFQAKKAMMPKFHEMEDVRGPQVIAPGGSVRISYSEDPSYFLIPGFPTAVLITKRQEDGSYLPVLKRSYGELVDKEPALGPLAEEGEYSLDGNFYICAGPGASDCAKVSLRQEIKVSRETSTSETRLELDLAGIARAGAEAGGKKPGEEEKQ